MRKKIDDGGFETPYRLRKQVVEPVFGQIKQARGLWMHWQDGSSSQGGFDMIIKSEMVSRRKALSLMGLAAFGLAAAPRYWRSPMLRPRQLVSSGVRSGAKGGIERRDDVARGDRTT